MNNGKRIVVVSTFSGIDFMMLAFLKAFTMPGSALEKNIWAALIHAANFKHQDGSPVMEFVTISKEEHDFLKVDEGKNGTSDDSTFINGKYIRGKTIQEVNGIKLRADIEKRYGKNIYIILIGGPPCTDLTKLNPKKRVGEKNRTLLIFEYLRILKELNPDVALMEEAQELSQKKNEGIFNMFLSETKQLPYNVSYMEMNSIHYGSNQQRIRTVVQMVHRSLDKHPVFPVPDLINAKRVRDFLDIDYFHSGNFTDKLKTSGHFMCTVTSGAPAYFIKDNKKRKPTIDEKLLCMDVEKGEYVIPDYIPDQQIKKAIGNGVSVAMFNKIATTIIHEILCLKHVGDGWFVPIDNTDGKDGISNNVDAPTPVITPESLTDNKPRIAAGSESAISLPPKTEDVNPTGHIPHEKGKPEIIPIPGKNLPVNPKKIINSMDLAKMDFDFLNFTNRWADFFGYPSPNFNCVLYGMAGEGKSTFAVQFAKYLADSFGPAIYISGEEGISKTFKDKLVNTKSVSSALDVVHLANLNEILFTLSKTEYKYVFIDSLDCINIDAADMRRLRSVYKSTAFITISQCTKAGEMRGSSQLKHDSDICVNIIGGIAVTTKNRFREKGMRFGVFQDMEEPQSYHEDNKGNTLVADNDGVPVNKLKPKRQSPKKVPLEQKTIQELHELLQKTLKSENYERAAKIRDELERRKNHS